MAGKDYLPFFDLDMNDGGLLDIVEPDPMGRETSDYFSDPIFVDSGIPIGAKEDLTTRIYVSTVVVIITVVVVVVIVVTYRISSIRHRSQIVAALE